ncbi:MAG: BglG family transcription antiterminator [Lactococcus raffinolactis]|uniref:BglG family transcription antiterminator n=1 Tax=Pseudolactococcus raffinolactis TaxID=1366 RepID=UPI00399697FA
MMLNNRQLELVLLLEKANKFLTKEFISQKLNVSIRTVSNDISRIRDELLQNGDFEFVSKAGVGIRLKKRGSINVIPSEDSSVSARRFDMMDMLLFQEQTVTYEVLSELFLVSKSSIKNDLLFLKKTFFKKNGSELLCSFQGTKIVGSEKRRQNTFLAFNKFICRIHDQNLDINFEEKLKTLSKYYSREIVETCWEILYEHVKGYTIDIADIYMEEALNVFIILVYRASKNHHLQGEVNNSFTPYNSMLMSVTERLGIEFSSTDMLRFETYLSNNKLGATYDQYEGVDITYLVTTFIEKMEQSLGVELKEDGTLKEALKKHFPALISRLQIREVIENPFLEQIKVEYPITFSAVWLVVTELEMEMSLAFNDNEVGFLAIYIQSALERNHIANKILVVCPTGLATSQLLLNQLNQLLPSLDTMEVLAISQIKYKDLSHYNFVISTVPFTSDDVEVQVVSNVLNAEDINNLYTLFNRKAVASKQMKPFTVKHFMALYQSAPNSIQIIDKQYLNKNQALEEISRNLIHDGFATDEFVQDILQRENDSDISTDLPTGVSVPHGNPAFVNKTGIFFIRNHKPIFWGKHAVKMIIVLCIAQKDHHKINGILSDLYSIVESKKAIEMIYQFKNIDDFSSLSEHIG